MHACIHELHAHVHYVHTNIIEHSMTWHDMTLHVLCSCWPAPAAMTKCDDHPRSFSSVIHYRVFLESFWFTIGWAHASQGACQRCRMGMWEMWELERPKLMSAKYYRAKCRHTWHTIPYDIPWHTPLRSIQNPSLCSPHLRWKRLPIVADLPAFPKSPKDPQYLRSAGRNFRHLRGFPTWHAIFLISYARSWHCKSWIPFKSDSN